MYSYWTGYSVGSIVDRIHELEGGGANKAFLNRSDISEFYDPITKTNESIVANIYNIKNDYVKHQNATNIARHVATNSIDGMVTKDFVKDRGFYDKDEIDTIISEKVEQKRAEYVYDDVDDPTQVMDSEGRLFLFGINDLGGKFDATYSSIGD